MFEKIMGLPAHPLLVHAAVVLVPLLAVTAIAYAVLPFTRLHLRWVVAVLAVIAPGAAYAAKLAGDAFREALVRADRFSPEVLAQVGKHQDFGNLTVYVSAGLGLVTLLMVFVIAPRRGAAPGSVGRSGARNGLAWVFGVLAAVGAGASLYYVYKTGDSGARMVWEGVLP